LTWNHGLPENILQTIQDADVITMEDHMLNGTSSSGLAVWKLIISRTSGNTTRISYDVCHMWIRHDVLLVISTALLKLKDFGFNEAVETGSTFKVRGSHVHGKIGNILETVRDSDVITTDH